MRAACFFCSRHDVNGRLVKKTETLGIQGGMGKWIKNWLSARMQWGMVDDIWQLEGCYQQGSVLDLPMVMAPYLSHVLMCSEIHFCIQLSTRITIQMHLDTY